MRHRAIALFLCSLLLILGCSRVLAADVPTPGGKTVLPLFQPILSSLERQTQVPIVLPTIIPTVAVVTVDGNTGAYIDVPITEDGHFRDTYASISDASTDSYEISLDATSDCQGADRCSFGLLGGQVVYQNTPSIQSEYAFELAPDFQPPARSPELMGEVDLANGIKGYFVPYVCGANCDTSKVLWEQNGYRFKVGIRYASKATMVEMANSAINNLS
jgi:hypothetical protein